MFNKKNRGFTLIEVLLVLAIAAIITVPIFLFYQDYKDQQAAKSMFMDIINVSNYIEDLYARGSDLEGINSASLHQMGFKTEGFKFDNSTQEYKHSFVPSGFSGGNLGEVHISTLPYRLTAAYQVRISGIKAGYVCSEVARNIRKFGKFTEMQIAGTQLTAGTINTMTDKAIDENCLKQPIINIVFIKDLFN
jgi:prepilin-type N-terminal cleavage/methylation domain-containing protein